MGLAVDERWAWHEFGHVMVYAATGQLELPFSHGVGDALAAVIGDPDSKLHGDDDPAVAGLTYPFVKLNRRHDRPADLGWCFCGRRSGLRALGGNRPMHIYADYFEEQLFSTALYRLYQCLGGATRDLAGIDNADDRTTRWRASDYVVYLIMVAIDQAKGVKLASGFVDLLIKADEARDFDIAADWPEGFSRPRVQRKRGRAVKVIRWAFEQQGLVEGLPIDQLHEGVAPPQKADIYIRACAETRRDGGYAPVELRWKEKEGLPWHATDIRVGDSKGVVVQVRDRSAELRSGVVVRAWWSAPSGEGKPLVWSPLGERKADAVGEFRFGPLTASGGYWVFAEASCTDDASNLGAGVAPPTDVGELMELVANDNNCGLALLR